MPGLDLWYKNAIVYSLDVKSYLDANGDGIGDFAGLTSRLDYLAGLGVTCLWLLPFYPSPDRDNGYDITDFYGVDPRLGSLGDFVEFTRQARMRGIRELIDLVINHTSNQQPWFQQARQDPRSPYRDYYVWSATKPADIAAGVVFPGRQRAVWTFDRRAGAWYFHRFYDYQPDLNIDSPAVREEIRKIMGFWLELGIAGFRLDAAPFVIEEVHDGAPAPALLYAYLGEFRDFLSWRSTDAIVLAEANVTMDRVMDYFGDGHRLQMMFNFWLNQHLFLALARQSAEPLERGLAAMPPIPALGQWASFVRNHDELDLGRLSAFERQEVYAAFGPEPRMQLFERGLRRRLAPMLGGDERRVRQALSLLFTLPGTPVLWYGDEIGMGEDLALDERNSVRTPMQWCAEPQAGFAGPTVKRLARPVIRKGPFAFARVNAAAQQRDPHSLLNAVERFIRVRKEHDVFGWGEWRLVDASAPSVFALRYDAEDRTALAVHNLSQEPCRTGLDLPAAEWAELFEIMADSAYPEPGPRVGELPLGPFGYRWFRRGARNV
jgi:maltose alpha-D-glucosyltransferase/alpha-amylase